MCKACGVALSDNGHWVTKDGRAVCHDCYWECTRYALETELHSAKVRLERVEAERHDLRSALRAVVTLCGGAASRDVSTEFLLQAPREVEAVVAERDKARDGWKQSAKTACEYQAERDQALAERDAARANYQWMVNRAADEKLDGYRELGARAAAAENERDALRARVANCALQHKECKECGSVMTFVGQGLYECWKCTALEARADAARLREVLGKLRTIAKTSGHECAGCEYDCDQCPMREADAALKEGGE